MSNAVIGALRGVLVLDTSDWTPAIGRARGDLTSLRGVFDQLGRTLDDVAAKARNWGVGLSAGVTAPLTALAVASNRTASDFEASMKRVEAALRGVTGKELKQLSNQARELGPAVGKGATEAADGIEALGLAGVSTADILGGSLKASLDLAAAGAAPVADAASLVTDVMGQFKVSAAQLPQVVGDVVGALDASKFGFIDFQQALAQGGGVAASAGINFRDFSTAIAATSTQFSSGSDAGTSFKTYIQSLVPISKEAEVAMKKLGIEFFDLKTGRMKPLAEQAEVLRKAFAGLSDKSKTDALKTIFGSDAARTAIGLMEKGRRGIADLQKEIASGDVSGKIGKRLEGEAAASVRLANAFESLKIAIGEAGLTQMITAVKNAFAGFVEKLAHASPAVMKVAVVIGGLVAALGPLAIVAGALASFVFAKLARGFGAIGWAISAVIEPIGTLGAALLQLLARASIGEGLALRARSFLGFVGPIGWAVTALLLFKDTIVTALGQVWKYASEKLGPPLAALFEKLGTIVGKLTSGPIGAGFQSLTSLFGAVFDVASTIVAGLIELLGTGLVNALVVAVDAISGIVEVISDIVDAVDALLRGDFAGAWSSATDAVDAACQTIIGVVTAIFPLLTGPIKTVYAAAKMFLVDGFAEIASGFTGIISAAVDWVSAAFPNVVDAARAVYQGVKTWLVDKFGGIMTWIGNSAKWIGDQYGQLKNRLGLGGANEASGSGSGGAAWLNTALDAAVTAWDTAGNARNTRVVDFSVPKTGRTKKDRDTKFEGENQDQLRIQAELEAARLRGDKEAEQRIQDQLALSKQVEAYQRTGLSLDHARIAAQRDMAMIQVARTAAAAKEIADERAATAIDIARIAGDQALEQSLERQAELKKRIAFYYEQTKNLAEATRLAEADQSQVDTARLRARQKWLADDGQDRALRLAQDRGDSEERIRQLQREVDIRERTRKLEDQGMSAPVAATQAVADIDEEARARVTGVWRSTLQDGMRAALGGNLGDWVKGWWQDRIAKGLENALNSLADLISNLFSKAGTGASGGGFLGKLGGVVGGLLGASKNVLSINPSAASAASGYDWSSLPGFATGGSFKVGGMSGIDNNLIAFRATKGEMVDIRRPGNDNQGGGRSHVVIEPTPYFQAVVRQEASAVATPVGVAAASQGRADATADFARSRRRRIPGR